MPKRECIACHKVDDQSWILNGLCPDCFKIINPIATDLTKLIALSRRLRFKIVEIECEDDVAHLPDKLLGIKITKK